MSGQDTSAAEPPQGARPLGGEERSDARGEPPSAYFGAGFSIIALGFVILTLPMGVLVTWLSKRLAVKR